MTAARRRKVRVKRPPGLIARVLALLRHFLGLLGGGYLAWVRARRRKPWNVPSLLARLLAFFVRPWVVKELRAEPFPVQLRRRFEMLGPTYIKLGQVLSVRRDLLPASVTDELENLLDHLPEVPFEHIEKVIENDLGRPVANVFLEIDPEPIGSASIAQIHAATTRAGDAVILKVVKPGVPETLRLDATLLRLIGRFLQMVIPAYQPRRIIREFCRYTLREVDMTAEADNAETFAANFRDKDGIVFPAVFRELSGEAVLCMERIDGLPATADNLARLSPEDRHTLIDLGADAVIRMVYQDGFFHADLHPANLRILPGPKLGFLDLGMAGRLSEELRRTLLYHYYCVLMGDDESAARHLAAAAEPQHRADPLGFRKEVAALARRWRQDSKSGEFSLAELILHSVQHGARHRMYFPMELVLMVKGFITYEGMGLLLEDEFDPVAISRTHVLRIFRRQLDPRRLAREGLKGAPDLLEALIRLPQLIGESVRMFEERSGRPEEHPLGGMRGTLYGGFCLITGGVLAAAGVPWPVWAILLVLGLATPLARR